MFLLYYPAGIVSNRDFKLQSLGRNVIISIRVGITGRQNRQLLMEGEKQQGEK